MAAQSSSVSQLKNFILGSSSWTLSFDSPPGKLRELFRNKFGLLRLPNPPAFKTTAMLSSGVKLQRIVWHLGSVRK